MLSGLSVRLIKVLVFNVEPSGILEPLFYEERSKTIWCCYAKDSLMNITCNIVYNPIWSDHCVSQSISDISIFQKFTPEKYTIIYMTIVVCLTKIVRHAIKRRKNSINKKEFKDLIDEITSTFISLENHITISHKNMTKPNDHYISCIIYHYTLLFTAKLILFNIELSPYIYKYKINNSKKYVKVKHKILSIENIIVNDYDYIKSINQNNDTTTSSPNIKKENIPISKDTLIVNTEPLASSSFSNIKYNNGNEKFIFTNNKFQYISSNEKIEKIQSNGNSSTFSNVFELNSYEKIVTQLENDYYKSCILKKIPETHFNYREYNENEEKNTDDSLEFLEYPPHLNDFDYESCFNVCLDTVDKATQAIKRLISYYDKSQLYYQNCLCWSFYNIGLFYMLIYANFKKDDAKEYIEFYHNQIRVMYKVYPILSLYYSKIYEQAKIEAYEAYSNDSIIFCPKGPF